jgi:hypothetical protein
MDLGKEIQELKDISRFHKVEEIPVTNIVTLYTWQPSRLADGRLGVGNDWECAIDQYSLSFNISRGEKIYAFDVDAKLLDWDSAPMDEGRLLVSVRTRRLLDIVEVYPSSFEDMPQYAEESPCLAGLMRHAKKRKR